MLLREFYAVTAIGAFAAACGVSASKGNASPSPRRQDAGATDGSTRGAVDATIAGAVDGGDAGAASGGDAGAAGGLDSGSASAPDPRGGLDCSPDTADWPVYGHN